MKLRPVKQAPTSCARCNAPFTETGGQVRALCTSCDYRLQELHYNSEYALYGKNYYACSPEGTSVDWLRKHPKYFRDVCASSNYPQMRGSKLWDETALAHPPPKPVWTIDEAFARTMRDGRRLYDNYNRNEAAKAQAKAARIDGGSKHGPTWAEREGYPALRYQPPRQKVQAPLEVT